MQRSAAKSIVCAGEALIDFIDGNAYVGGAPANVACALARLGTPSRLIACVGEDSRGDLVLRTLRERGVDTRLVQRSGAFPTRGVRVRRNASGDRTFTGFDPPDTHFFADTQLDASRIPANALDDACALVIGTLGLAAPASRAAIERCVELADSARVPVVLDANRRDIFWTDPSQALAIVRTSVLSHASVIKLSEDEALWLFDTGDPSRIVRISRAAIVLITFGAQGCAYATRTSEGHVAAMTVRPVDTTGAGDAFVAGFLHRLSLAGMSTDDDVVDEAARCAVIAGALTTRSAGALDAQPTNEEIAAQRT
ncbi:MAG: carbohydrate kinase family protein [Vulcanimicrobiaceae bacterium]